MIPFLPKPIADKAVTIYVLALTVVSIVFMSHAMSLIYIVLGLMWVIGFFYLSSYFSRMWGEGELSSQQFLLRLWGVGISVRVVWVIFSYFYYQAQTGLPFEFGAGDSVGYHEDAAWLADDPWSTTWWYLFTSGLKGIADSGYPLYLSIIYRIFGPNIFVARILKCIIGTATCWLIYKLAKRSFGESVGRMASIFAMLMPNFIIYCGLHLKEVEMIFLAVAFLERTDAMLRSKEYKVVSMVLSTVLALSLFLFRTVLGAVALFSFVTALIFTTEKVVTKGKRALIIGWVLLAGLFLFGGTLHTEMESLWENRSSNVEMKRYQQTVRGNKWAKYATGTVMAPMAMFLPYPTMVDVDHQYNQQIIHGGNYVRNFFGIFVLIAIFSVIFIQKNWRDFSLLGSFVFGYLGVISMSGFSNSERFLLPALPVLLMMAAYGISLMNGKNYRYVKIWFIVVFMMAFAWAFFKLGSRGIVG